MAAPKKIDFKKKFPLLYSAKVNKPVMVEVPPMKFYMVDGHGDPNSSQEYKKAIETLYAVAYTLKMKIVKKKTPSKDYVVPPLEGLWYMDNMTNWSMDTKDDWDWTMMIRIPDFVSEKNITLAIEMATELKNPPAIKKLQVESYEEGQAAQILHIGAYDDEPPTIIQLHEFIAAEGFELSGKHHEIYLSDPRRVKPEKLKTIIRQPVSPVKKL